MLSSMARVIPVRSRRNKHVNEWISVNADSVQYRGDILRKAMTLQDEGAKWRQFRLAWEVYQMRFPK